MLPNVIFQYLRAAQTGVFLKVKIDLNAGTGEPCAGQRRVEYLPLKESTLDIFELSGNFGGDPPTGSVNIDVLDFVQT